jgi:hypothetical protein
MSLLDLARRRTETFAGWTAANVRPPVTPLELYWELQDRSRVHRKLGVRLNDRIGFTCLWLIQRLAYNLGWWRGLGGRS